LPQATCPLRHSPLPQSIRWSTPSIRAISVSWPSFWFRSSRIVSSLRSFAANAYVLPETLARSPTLFGS